MFLHVRVTLQGGITTTCTHELRLWRKLIELPLSHLHLLMHVLPCTLYPDTLVEFHSSAHHLGTHWETRLMRSYVLNIASMLVLYPHLGLTLATRSLLIIHVLLLAYNTPKITVTHRDLL